MAPCCRQLVPACSFQPMLHPHYEIITAECDAWILAFAEPPSDEAAQFLGHCLYPLFTSLTFPECLAQRLLPLSKLLAWFFLADSDDDNLSIRGCRRDLILACFAGEPLSAAPAPASAVEAVPQMPNVTKGLAALHGIWKDISKDMPPKLQSRFLEAARSYLEANRVQAQFRSSDRLPGVDEYVKFIRRPASLVLPCLILMEYGLGIELDDDTLQSEHLMQLHDSAVDHIALYNDLFSFEAEVRSGDYFNLPSVIFRARQQEEPGFTISDAVGQAVSMVEEVDKLSAQLMAQAQKSSLMEKPGVEAYLRGAGLWMAGNVEWSHETARYGAHTCTPQGVVLPVQSSSYVDVI